MTLRSRILPAVGVALAATLGGGAPAFADPSITVEIDHARVLKTARPAATVIIGNPAIADVTVQDAHTMVLTGRSYGTTNLIVLDDAGKTVIDESVGVKGFEAGTVRIYRQAQRETMSCSPECQPTVTIGDNDIVFTQSATQFALREKMAIGSK